MSKKEVQAPKVSAVRAKRSLNRHARIQAYLQGEINAKPMVSAIRKAQRLTNTPRGTERKRRRAGLQENASSHFPMLPAKVAAVDLVALSGHNVTLTPESVKAAEKMREERAKQVRVIRGALEDTVGGRVAMKPGAMARARKEA